VKDPVEFLESVKIDLFPDEVYVFTPRGDVRVLPRGSTPFDFAYAIHSEVGHHCSGARANGQIVPLRYKLKSGDVMEIMNSANQQPTKDWLDFAVSTAPRSRIRPTCAPSNARRASTSGRELLENEMRSGRHQLPEVHQERRRSEARLRALEVYNLDDLLLQVGYGKIEADQVIDLLKGGPHGVRNGEAPPSMRQGKIEQFVRKVTGRDQGGIKGQAAVDDVLVRYAKCCNPLPETRIIGFITRGRGVTIHRRECMKAFDIDPERRIEVSWDSKAKINRPCSSASRPRTSPASLAT
jgi:GTP pyrophosphokinase